MTERRRDIFSELFHKAIESISGLFAVCLDRISNQKATRTNPELLTTIPAEELYGGNNGHHIEN